MKKLAIITLFLAIAGLTNPAIADTKVAIVDVGAVIASSAQVQALKNEQQQKIIELDKWLQIVRADVDKQQTKEGKEKLIKKYDATLLKKRETIAKEYQKKLLEIDKSISKTIAEQAQLKGYDVVLTKGSVLYGADDITADIQKVVK